MSDDADATKLVDTTKDFGDRYVEIVAWRVPPSDRYPEGVKYAMQYGNAAGETIIRYDNVPDHPGAARHHKHTRDGVEDVDFTGLRPLLDRFKAEVTAHGHDW